MRERSWEWKPERNIKARRLKLLLFPILLIFYSESCWPKSNFPWTLSSLLDRLLGAWVSLCWLLAARKQSRTNKDLKMQALYRMFVRYLINIFENRKYRCNFYCISIYIFSFIIAVCFLSSVLYFFNEICTRNLSNTYNNYSRIVIIRDKISKKTDCMRQRGNSRGYISIIPLYITSCR